MPQKLDAPPQQPRLERRKRSVDRVGVARAHFAARACPHLPCRTHHDSRLVPKKGDEARLSLGDTLLEAVAGDALEIDELVIRYRFKRRYKYLWIAVSRLTHQVIAFVIGDRSTRSLKKLWHLLPAAYRRKLVYTDFYHVYGEHFSAWQHRPCDKGSGKTSIVEGLNNKWRNRVSGLVRKTVCVRYLQELENRLWMVFHQHNLFCIRQIEKLIQTPH